MTFGGLNIKFDVDNGKKRVTIGISGGSKKEFYHWWDIFYYGLIDHNIIGSKPEIILHDEKIPLTITYTLWNFTDEGKEYFCNIFSGLHDEFGVKVNIDLSKKSFKIERQKNYLEL